MKFSPQIYLEFSSQIVAHFWDTGVHSQVMSLSMSPVGPAIPADSVSSLRHECFWKLTNVPSLPFFSSSHRPFSLAYLPYQENPSESGENFLLYFFFKMISQSMPVSPCYRLSCVPPTKGDVGVLNPIPQNVTLFEEWALTKIIKLK